MSLAHMSLYTIGALLPVDCLSQAKRTAEEFVKANPRVVDKSSDLTTEMVKATPVLSTIFVKYLGARPENQQIISLLWILAAVESIKNDLDSMSEMGEMESLRLQLAMDRMSQLMTTLSNLLKKASETAQTITQNLK
jgi:hypothetical protein